MKSVENAGNIKENSDSILEKLEYLVKQGRDGFTDEILAELREQAKSEFDSNLNAIMRTLLLKTLLLEAFLLRILTG